MQSCLTSEVDYYSDRERGPRPRVAEQLSPGLWGGVVAAINSRIGLGEFGRSYPEKCPDGSAVCGVSKSDFLSAALAEIPGLAEAIPLDSTGFSLTPYTSPLIVRDRQPDTLSVLDLVEFSHRHVSKVIPQDFHEYFSHHHYRFDVPSGQGAWRDDMNRLFARNGAAYELNSRGQVIRLGTPVATDRVRSMIFDTGDGQLDQLLERARDKYLSADAAHRRESLEQLWDAFERMKTLSHKDKDKGITKLLAGVASSGEVNAYLTTEARSLTSIGNNFRIRHHETTKAEIGDVDIDYLFHRCFAFLAHVLELNPS